MANTYDTNVKLQAIATAIANSGTSDPNLLAKLQAIADAITLGSNTDYDNMTNKPQINSVTLSGNKTPGDLGLVASSSVGVASGVAELDNTGHVPSSQLPSYVDDVVEGYYNNVTDKFYSDNAYTTEIPGETGKIYITLDTNLSYRYTGSGFVVVSPSLALGETSSTAYRGDRGKIAYDTSQSNSTAIGNINTALGNTSIAAIGDGSVTGAISSIDGDVNTIETTLGNTSISGVGDGSVTGAISTLNNSMIHRSFINDVAEYNVNITAYQLSYYTIPKDGYILLVGGTGAIQLSIGRSGWVALVANSYVQYNAIFVQKGQEVSVSVDGDAFAVYRA